MRERWTPELTSEFERELVLAAQRPGSAFPASPFGTTAAGRVDVRGARLTTPIRHLRASGVDLSDVVFADGASVTESELEDCVLDRIDMRGAFVRRRFVGCSFVGARLAGARLGGVFEDCDFSGATLSRSVASGARFERCTFTGASLRDVMWTTRCVFDHCEFDGVAAFTGSVAGSVFVGPTRPDLSGCIVDHVQYQHG
ncbi:hypothetical protein GCM10009857_31500 [Agromyces soli]